MDKKVRPKVIGVASGKGGVGKTTVSINLAVSLAMRGHKVMLLDADMGLANAQIALGVSAPLNISHFLSGQNTLEEIAVETTHGVRLIPGASGLRDMAAMGTEQVVSVIRAFDQLTWPVDFFVVDVAAGLSPAVLEFMAACERRVVVVNDQPSSIADAYALVKVMATELALDEIYLLPNMVDSADAGQQLFRRLSDVCTRFLGVTVNYLHSIESDELVLIALRKYRSVVEHAPGSAAARDFRKLAECVEKLPDLAHASGRLQFFLDRKVSP